jgi:hypothetical protein
VELDCQCGEPANLSDAEYYQKTFGEPVDYQDKNELPLFMVYRDLGFVPELKLCLPHIPRIRAACEYYREGKLTLKDCVSEIRFHNTNIRNDCFAKKKFKISKLYEPWMYELYYEYEKDLIESVHNRLTNLLGYEPDLEHSAEGEIFLMEYFVDDKSEIELPAGQYFEYEFAELARYRKAYLNEGKDAANKLSLLCVDRRIAKNKTT